MGKCALCNLWQLTIASLVLAKNNMLHLNGEDNLVTMEWSCWTWLSNRIYEGISTK